MQQVGVEVRGRFCVRHIGSMLATTFTFPSCQLDLPFLPSNRVLVSVDVVEIGTANIQRS